MHQSIHKQCIFYIMEMDNFLDNIANHQSKAKYVPKSFLMKKLNLSKIMFYGLVTQREQLIKRENRISGSEESKEVTKMCFST